MPAGEGRLVRPLLGVTREQTAAYCRERGLGWREDESNSDERFARTRVRDGVLPALRAVHPAAEANVLRTAALLREETELLDGLVAAELDGAARASQTARLRALPAALARMVVVRLAEDAAGTYVPQAGEPRGRDPRARPSAAGGPSCTSGAGWARWSSGGVLEMVKLPPRAGVRLPRGGHARARLTAAHAGRNACQRARICAAGWPSSGSRSRATTRAARCCWWGC